MTRDELIARTRQLIDEGDRLAAEPSLGALQVWLQLSDDLLSTAWGSMDRYHLAWLLVGKPKGTIRGRAMTAEEEAAYVREVAEQKTAALRMSLDAVERQECRSLARPVALDTATNPGILVRTRCRPDASAGPPARPELPQDPSLAERLADARRQAEEHLDHERRAPRVPSACSGDGGASRPGGRRNADGPRAGPDRP